MSSGRLAPRAASHPGFTMAEVLVAIGVLTAALLGMITVFLASHSDISQGGRDTAATAAALSLAENMRNQPPPDLSLLDGMNTDDPSLCPGAPGSRLNTLCTDWIAQVAQLPEGRGTVAVTQTPNPVTGITLRQMTITVTWNEASRGGRQLTLVAGRSD
jgi:Tfp pilus assembly protein PilV